MSIEQAYKKVLREDAGDLSIDDLVKDISASKTDYDPIRPARFREYGENSPVKQLAAPEMNYRDIYNQLQFHYKANKPLMIYGDPGLGKSSIFIDFAKTVGKKRPTADGKGFRKFVKWQGASTEEKKEIYNNPGDYFVYLDIRISGYERTDFTGLMKMDTDKDYLETQKYMWVMLCAKPEMDGILFFDELSHGDVDTLKTLFQVTLDREVGDVKFSKNLYICAASNVIGEEPIPEGLTKRFSIGVLIADPKGWMKWARENGVHESIIMFINAGYDSGGDDKLSGFNRFYNRPLDPRDQSPNPRNFVDLSDLINTIHSQLRAGEIEPEEFMRHIEMAAKMRCGDIWGGMFVAFLRYFQVFDFTKLSKEPSTIWDEATTDQRNSIMVFVVRKVSAENNDPEVVNGFAKFISYIEPEAVNNVANYFKDFNNGKYGFFRDFAHMIKQGEKFDGLSDEEHKTLKEKITRVLRFFNIGKSYF